MFRVPAFVRNMAWGIQTDEHGEAITIPDEKGAPRALWAGEFWLLSDAEAGELSLSWARLINYYFPDSIMQGGSVLTAALMSTASIVGPRLFTDAERARVVKDAAERARAGATVVDGMAQQEPHMYAQAAD